MLYQFPLTVLSYSGGKQSAWLLWRLILGLAPVPQSFAVINADPGMENSLTYKYNRMMQEMCRQKGIHYEVAQGPNLYQDLISLKDRGASRIDNPPYWTVDDGGKVGRLLQKCTKRYKIAPMDRVVRRLLRDRYAIRRLTGRVRPNSVEKWIGFAADEVDRVTLSGSKYAYFRFPLIEDGLTKLDVENEYVKHGIEPPPRSVCNACFANGLETYRDMHENRPGDWDQAVSVDESVRDLSPVGVHGRVFVSPTCVPLRQLAAQNFRMSPSQVRALQKKKKGKVACGQTPLENPIRPNVDDYSCDSGHCFL